MQAYKCAILDYEMEYQEVQNAWQLCFANAAEF